ncbi:TolC family protein [Alphaproteobacteria bacterium]|nr:TolC family protein [Alphaproteobacteria bacterium]
MAKIKIIFLSTFFLFFSKGILSYEITDLIKILVEKNETNSQFKYDNLIDDKNLELADTLYIPEIDYSFSFSNSTTSTNSTSTVNADTHTLSATVNLYNGGFSQLNLITTQTRNQAFDYLREYQKELLIKELLNGYSNLQTLVFKKKNQQLNLEFYRKKVLEAEILFKANRITKTEVLDLENELLEAQSVSLDYDRKIDNLMLQVSKLLDLDIYDEDVNFDYVIDVSNAQISKKLFSELMNSSYGKYLSFIENTYLPELEMSKKDLRPSIDLTYSLSESDNYSAAINHRRSSSLSLSLSVPIYDGFKDENNFDIEEYNYQKKLLEHKDLKRDLLNTYLESWNNYDFYLNKINNQEKIIDSLELKLQGNEILYKAQKIDITQLIESKNELNDAHNILLDLKSSKKYYLIDILILNGDLNTIINGLG